MLHIDSLGTADDIPFGVGSSPPYIVIRVQPLAGDVCSYSVASTDPSDPGDRNVVRTGALPSVVVRTSKSY